ncbi:MAG: hypothetical protein MESAZ_02290 [Saezia sanguinis]
MKKIREMKNTPSFRQSLLSRCIVLALASLGASAVVQAQQITFNDGNTGHVLENQTVDRVSVSGDGTGAEISGVTANGEIFASFGSTMHVVNSSINCAASSNCYGLWVQGLSSNQAGVKTTVTGSGLVIDSGRSGIVSNGSASIDLSDVRVNAVVYGLELNGSLSKDGVINATRIRDFEITAGQYGVHAMFGAELHLTNGTITTTGDGGVGLYLGGSNNLGTTPVQTAAYMSGVTVHTKGDDAYGLYSVQMAGTNGKPNRGAVSYWDASHIITEGADSYGIVANYSWNTVTLTNGSTVTTAGDNAYAVWSRGAADVTLDRSHVATRGQGAVGVYSYHLGNSYLQNGSTVMTEGAGAHGTMLQYAGNIMLDNSSVHAQGADAHGIYMLVGLAENAGSRYGSKVELQNSSIVSDQGYGIATEGGHLTVNVLNGSTLKGGAGLMNVQDYTGGGTPSWDQGVTTVNLLVDGGSVVSGNVITADTAVSNITLQGGSTWELNGDSNVTSLVNRDSTISFASGSGLARSGSGFSTLHVSGDYMGDGGTIILNAALHDDNNSLSDRLVVDGDVSGQTYIKVINRGGLGAATQEGVRIVEVGGQSPADAFTLQSDYVAINGKPAVVAGAYSYSLYQGGVTDPADGHWYLRSDVVEILNPGGGGGTITVPVYQPGTPLYESYANVLHELNALPTLRERVGERQLGAVVTGEGMAAQPYGVWARAQGSHNHFEPRRSTTGAEQDVNVWRMQIGADMLAHENAQGSLVAGVSAHYGYASSDVESLFGSGKIDAKGYGIGGALTWYGNNGFYADAQAQLNWFDSNIKSSTLGVTEVSGNDGKGYAFGLEVGRSFALNDNWSLTPQAQIIYSHVDYDDFYDAYLTPVSLQNHDRATGRLGLSADYRQRMKNGDTLDAYGIVNLYQNLSGSSKVNVAGVEFEQRNERTWAGLGLGASYSWGQGKYALYGEAGVKTSVQSFGDSYGVTGNVGLRVRF